MRQMVVGYQQTQQMLMTILRQRLASHSYLGLRFD